MAYGATFQDQKPALGTNPNPPPGADQLPPKPQGAPGQPQQPIYTQPRSKHGTLAINTTGVVNATREKLATAIWRTAVIDNLSNQWLWVAHAHRFVPPWQWGVVLALDNCVAAFDLDWGLNNLYGPGLPISETNTTPTGFGAYWSVYEESMTPNPGVSVTQWGTF